jgi:hypothetical protein
MCMNIYFYEYMYVHPTSINISERLSWLKIHEVNHQERLTINKNIISCKISSPTKK